MTVSSAPSQYELLAESAPLARSIAAQTCFRGEPGDESCAWSHGIWQVLRLLRLITTPDDQAAFYDSALAEHAASGRTPRILVSGAADYGMLAEVLPAFRSRGVEPRVLVTDLCETPLVLNRWYADRLGFHVETLRTDILDLRDAEGFDAICTHSFFGRFAPARRPQLMETWHRLLKPGGTVVTVNRLRPAAGAEKSTFAGDAAAKLGSLVRESARAFGPPLADDAEALGKDAEAYARRPGGHPLRTREELEALFSGAGLSIERFETAPVAKGAGLEVRGPTVPAGAVYASWVARKPRT